MGIFNRKSGGEPDPEKVGQNPTGRERKSSAGKRRQKDNNLYKGTEWDKRKGK